MYGFKGAPNTDKALIAAQYTGVKIDLAALEMGKTNKSEEFLTKVHTRRQQPRT